MTKRTSIIIFQTCFTLLTMSGCQKGFKSASNGLNPLGATSCVGTGPVSKGTVRLCWTPNRETLVNSVGGGYAVTLSESSSFSSPQVFDIPFDGTKTPSTVDFTNLKKSTTYYAKVTGYSKSADGSVRAMSQESIIYKFTSPRP